MGLSGGNELITRVMIRRNEYRDSVFLMVVNEAVRGVPGVEEVAVMMGTDNNKGIIRAVGFLGDAVEAATPRDILICIRAVDESAVGEALARIDLLLSRKTATGEAEGVYKTLDAAVREIPASNLAIISVPGPFAGRETRKALKLGLNVLLFSDNVPVEEEVELKRLASRLNRIVMGPDCGTAIINHVPLAFANVVRPGPIGLLAASGTGMQEVACLIDRAGEGISQAIGTGGRDLSDRVGGLSALQGMDILEEDEATRVIVLISKPPGAETMGKILGRVARCPKPVVVDFLGADPKSMGSSGALAARTLEEAASLAVAAARGEKRQAGDLPGARPEWDALLKRETESMAPGQRFIRGLYSGGTLCYESMLILRDAIGDVHSNIPLRPELLLRDLSRGKGHTLIDLGDDAFTQGRPHPMISPESRKRYIASETDDPEVAVLLLDVVLGYGSHRDMAGALSENIQAAKEKVARNGGYLSVVASVCGTAGDPQDSPSQVRRLEEGGAVVMPSNAQAARFAAMVSRRFS
jgi:FdrA protein